MRCRRALWSYRAPRHRCPAKATSQPASRRPGARLPRPANRMRVARRATNKATREARAKAPKARAAVNDAIRLAAVGLWKRPGAIPAFVLAPPGAARELRKLGAPSKPAARRHVVPFAGG